MHKKNIHKKGFTLIELLIVIAIIGVLAATVVISLGDRTGTAKDTAVEVGISSLRNAALAAASVDNSVDAAICNTAYGNIVSSEKADWYWAPDQMCTRGTLTGETAVTPSGDGAAEGGLDGDLCCYANGSDWVVWGPLSAADGYGNNSDGATADAATEHEGNDIFCADSEGFVGEINLADANTLMFTGGDVDDRYQCE